MPSSLTGPWTGIDSESAWGGIHVDSAHVVGVVNALGVSSRPHSSPPPHLVAAHHPEAHSRHHVPLRFTGTGFGYSRIWLVNLLLTLLTLGFYHPWARARRLAWNYAHTQVDGHPLAFHGEACKMLDKLALLWALVLLGWMAQAVSRGWALVGLATLALSGPYFCRVSERYRLRHTSWRGLRFRLGGRLVGAYRAQLPLWVVALALALTLMASPEPVGRTAVAAAVLGTLILAPLLLWNSKRYLHNGFSLGPLKARFRGSPLHFYKVAASVTALALAALPGAAALGWGAVEGTRLLLSAWGGDRLVLPEAGAWLLGVALALSAVALVLVPLACLRAGLQNLLWSHTGNSRVRFKSSLRFWPLWRLWFKNCTLLVGTFGLYWPFAVVAATRLQLEAVTLVTRIELDELVNLIQHRERSRLAKATGRPT